MVYILDMKKKSKSLAVKLVKAASREHIGTLPRPQVTPRRRKPGRDRVKDDL